MPQLSDRVQTFTDSVIRRMTRICNRYDAINLSQGFPDFDPPQEMMDALAAAAHKGPHQYAVTFGAQNFREALARTQGKRMGLEIDPQTQIVVTCGGTEAMMSAMMTICNPGDKVLVFSPFYENYGADAILSGAQPVYIPLVPPEYNFDIGKIEQGFRDGAKAIIICNPNNPCGKVFTREELMQIGALAVQYDAWVVTDEVYEYIVYEPAVHVHAASLPGMFDHTITCSSLSKTYSVTGWRLGYALGPAEIIAQMTKLHQYGIMSAPTTAQYAAIEALKNGDRDVNRMRDEYDMRRRLVVDSFNDMGLSCFEPLGAFYVFPCIKSTGLSSDEFCTRLIMEKHVAVVPGTAFGACGDGFVRVSYSYSLKHLKIALQRIREFLEELKNGN